MRCSTCHRRLGSGADCPLHGPCAPEPLADTVPESPPVPPGYVLESLLGSGGAGQVYAAHKRGESRMVALKLGAPGSQERFAVEAEALRRLGAPDGPALFDAGEVEGRPFLAMERLEGETLAAWMARQPGHGAVAPEVALGLARQVSEVLGRVHATGLVHRDVKPENIFLRAGGTVALLDFGLARMGAQALGLTQEGQRLGTVHYMAPEQCQDARLVDARADVYALGVLLFELLTGRPPFVGEAPEVVRGHLSLRPPRPSSLAPLPPEVDAVVLRCLAKEPSARFDDGAALARALREVEGTLALGGATAAPVPPMPVPPPPQGAASSSLRRVVLLGAGLHATARAVLDRVASEGGSLGRLHGEGCIVTFHEHPSPLAGLRAAVRATRALLGAGMIHGATLHVAELRVRPGRSGTRLAGAALEKPETWWRSGTEPSLLLTEEAASLLAPHEVLASGPDRFTLQEQASPEPAVLLDAEPPPLVGREELLAELSARAREALAGDGPCLTLLESEPGQGKSRLLTALAETLSTQPIRVLTLRASAPDVTQEPLSVELDRQLDGLGVPHAPAPEGSDAAARLGTRLREQARRTPLALLVDDAHHADALCLDALERATLGGEPLPLWVCLAAPPELRTLRPHLGDRATRFTVHPVPPLSSSAARALLRELLRPVEFIAEPALAHLESLAQGNPLALVELVGTLRESGAVRPGAQRGAWVLAPDELPRDAIASPFERVVQRVRSALPSTSGLLASLCAVLGESFSREEVEAAQHALETATEPPRELAALDAGAGLGRLTRAGVLESLGGGRYAFRHRLLRDALRADTPVPLRRALHRAVLHSLTARNPIALESPEFPSSRLRRLAEHAAACGEHALASRAFLALGERARLAHRDVESEQSYTAALAHLPEEAHAQREQALGGRGRVRSRTQRFREAIEDLSAARALADARGDDAAVVDLLLAEATLHDWLERPEDSERTAELAFQREHLLTDARLRLRCALARGRHQARQAHWAEAVDSLSAAIREAERLGDFESEAIGRLVLGVALAFLQRVEESAACFEEVITRSRARQDLLHLGTAHLNRLQLWLRLHSVEPALEDLREAVRVARELGHVQLERWASYNLAEVYHWSGRDSEALPLARRALTLGERFFGDERVILDAVLVARVAMALNEPALARDSLAWVERHAPAERWSPLIRVQIALTRKLLAQAEHPRGHADLTAWQALLDEAAPVATDDEALEILLHATEAARAAGNPAQARAWWDEAWKRASTGAPHWKPRLAALEPQL